MKVEFTTAYEVDVDHLDPKFVDIRGFAIDEARRMLHDDIFFGETTDENFDAKIVEEDLYFEHPTQLKIEERVDPCSDLVCYGAIGFQDKIICMDNGHVHPTSAVGDYLTIVETYHKWLNLSDETIGN